LSHNESDLSIKRILLLFAILAAVSLGTGLWAHFSQQREVTRLRQIAPGLDLQIATLLAAGNRSELETYCAEIGELRARTAYVQLLQGFYDGDIAQKQYSIPRLQVMAEMMADVYFTEVGLHHLSRLKRGDYEVITAARLISSKTSHYVNNPDIADSTQIKFFEESLQFLEENEFPWIASVLHAEFAKTYARIGNDEAMHEQYRKALAVSRRCDSTQMTCQLLGTMGFRFYAAGQVDSARHYLTLLQTRAARSKMANQTARGTAFLGALDRAEGRLGSAGFNYREARRQCRELQGGEIEIRYIARLGQFYADLGCWDLVDRLLAQVSLVVSDLEPDPQRPHVNRSLLLAAQALHYKGERAAAQRIASHVLANNESRPYIGNYAMTLWYNARLLIDDNKLDEARLIIRQGLAHARTDGISDYEQYFTLQAAECAAAADSLDRARELMATYWGMLIGDENVARNEARRAYLLDLRLNLTKFGDGPELIFALARAFSTLGRVLSQSDPSADTYLMLQVFDPLRAFVHEMLAADAELGLRFEFGWRRLARLRSQGRKENFLQFTEREIEGEDVATWVENWLQVFDQSPDLTSAPSPLLVYSFVDNEVLRWTVSGNVQRDVLNIGPDELRQMISEALMAVSQPPQSPARLDPMRRLAQVLLPQQVMDEYRDHGQGTSFPKMFIAVDDALSRLPFEALDIGLGADYQPLDDHCEVTYVRYIDRAQNSPFAGNVLVVADPLPAAKLVRRFPDLVHLPGARTEAEEVLKIWPSANYLANREATKAAMLAQWEENAVIYIASHVVRDPEIPYLKFIPLTPGASTDPIDNGMLEMSDILSADLRGVELVVLSGCSSGTPYTMGSRLAPGLGSVFLDAGCRTTVQTSWRVGDENAQKVMTNFATIWGQDSSASNVATALHQARRQMRTENAHPFYWAAYHVVTSDPLY